MTRTIKCPTRNCPVGSLEVSVKRAGRKARCRGCDHECIVPEKHTLQAETMPVGKIIGLEAPVYRKQPEKEIKRHQRHLAFA